MEKILKYIKNYFSKSSWIKISTDFFFYLLLLIVLIPSTRAILLRATLIRPKVLTEESALKLDQGDLFLVLEDMNGKTINLADYSGQTIFINFWATWCPPCRAELPSMQKLFNSFGGNMPMFLITSEERKKVEAFLNEYNYNLPVYFQKSNTLGVLNINSYPTSFLVSGKGEILIIKKGAANWDSGDFKRKLNDILAVKQD